MLVHPAHHPHPTWRLKHGPAALARETALTQLGAFHFCSPLSGNSPRVRSARADPSENGKHALRRRRNATSWSQQRHPHCCSSVAAGTCPNIESFSVLHIVSVNRKSWMLNTCGITNKVGGRRPEKLELQLNWLFWPTLLKTRAHLQIKTFFRCAIIHLLYQITAGLAEKPDFSKSLTAWFCRQV